MSMTVGAALKKVAVYILTDKKALKIVGGIVLGIIIIIIMPIVALVGMFSGNIEINTDHLHQMIQQDQSTLVAKWSEVENEFIAAGFDNSRIEEAQTLFVFALYNHVNDEGFKENFVACFESQQTDDELINKINNTFATHIKVEDFKNATEGTRNAYIKTTHYTDPMTKNNLDLVKWAEFAAEKHWGYVYGTYGTVLDQSMLDSKVSQYPDEVGSQVDFIKGNWLGKRTTDCVGLIKGYAWFDVKTQSTLLVSNGMPDIGANAMYENATEKGGIDTIPEIKGLAVWHEGHIGVYIGNGKVVEAYGTQQGVIQSDLANGSWTHWLKIPYITYK